MQGPYATSSLRPPFVARASCCHDFQRIFFQFNHLYLRVRVQLCSKRQVALSNFHSLCEPCHIAIGTTDVNLHNLRFSFLSIWPPSFSYPAVFSSKCRMSAFANSSGPPSKYVTLVSSEGFEFVVLRQATYCSPTIKKMLDPAHQWAEAKAGRCVFPEIRYAFSAPPFPFSLVSRKVRGWKTYNSLRSF